MGIHTWDSYSGYENKALKSYIETIERFCSECHTNENYNGCENCPTGIFVNNLKRYLLEIHESDILKDQTKLFKRMKRLIKKMSKLHPLYLPVDEDYEFNSVFNKLKKLCFELELWEECLRKKFEWKMHIADIMSLGEKRKRKQKGENLINKIKWQRKNK